MPKRYYASMSIKGYRIDDGSRDTINLCLYGPLGGTRVLEAMTVAEANMLREQLNLALEAQCADELVALREERAKDKCGTYRCPDDQPHCSCRHWAEQRCWRNDD